MKKIKLEKSLPNTEADKLKGTFLTESHYDVLVSGEDVEVLKPNGTPLLIYLHNVLDPGVCEAAYLSLRKAAKVSVNRGYAAGEIPQDPDKRQREVGRALPGFTTKVRARPLKQDGTVSNTNYAQQVESGIVGYFDRNARFPYCRLTAFNLEEPQRFEEAMPFIRSVNEVFGKYMPERYEKQMAAVQSTSKDFVIHATAFTTITVNRNWQTAVHKDAGDLRVGFGVMSALCAGEFDGCYLVFPKYRVAVNMRTRGVCLADVHEWHGNTPFLGKEGEYERVSCVFYYRRNMRKCKSAAEEREQEELRKKGTGPTAELSRRLFHPGFVDQ